MSPFEPLPVPSLASNEAGMPWVETPAGGRFFMNAVLIAPELIVLFPLGLGAVLRATGLVRGSSLFLDMVPLVAAHVIPYVGWLLVIPMWTTARNLKVESGRIRMLLFCFLVLHTSFLGYTVLRWTGVLAAP